MLMNLKFLRSPEREIFDLIIALAVVKVTWSAFVLDMADGGHIRGGCVPRISLRPES